MALPKTHKARESDYILARTAHREIQGFLEDHLSWDYIICFRSAVRDELKRLKEAFTDSLITSPQSAKQPKATIKLIQSDHGPVPTTAWASSLMKGLDSWVSENFKYENKQWTVPTKPMKGQWRTKQIIIPKSQNAELRKLRDGKTELLNIAVETKCQLNTVKYLKNGSLLVTISGKEADVQTAAERVETFWI